jgi:hypothetical protein
MSMPERPGVSGDGEAAHGTPLPSAPYYKLKLTLGTCCLSLGIGLSQKLVWRDAAVSLDGMTALPRLPQKRSYKNYSGKRIGLANASSFAIFKNCDPVR